MKRLIYIKILCALLLATSVSCVKDNGDDVSRTYNGEKASLPIYLKSKVSNSTASDEEISTVRCIVFAEGGKLVGNTVTPIAPGTTPCVISAEAAIGENDFYIICNETSDLTNQLDKVKSPQQIKDIRFTPPVAGVELPVPMYVKVPGVKVERTELGAINITVEGVTSSSLSVTATRIVSKLGMTVIKNIPSGELNFSIEKLTYRLCRLPKYSFLEQGNVYPEGEGWASEIQVTGAGNIEASSNGDFVESNGVYTVPAGVDAINFPITYIPEHVLQDKESADYCTYLLIEAECQTEYSSSPIRAVYRFNLGKTPPTDMNLERNINYQIYVTIRGMGAAGFYAEIVPIDEYDLPITWKPFEGYVIVGERVEDYGRNTNIWNSYSQYSGILKVVLNGASGSTYNDVCFRYGSVVALSSTATAGAFNPSTDVVWMPDVTKTHTPVASWSDIAYMMTSEDVSGANHTLENIKLGKGDPCRLVGLSESEIAIDSIDNHLWRLPTSVEMKWLETARNSAVDARGFYSFSHLLTPLSGYRNETGDMVPNDSVSGYYWTATTANSFVFNNSNSSVLAVDNPARAYAVRCIRTDIPESLFNMEGTKVNYNGGSANLSVGSHSVNIPYWRMEVDPSHAANVSLAKSEGRFKEVNQAIVQPLVNPYIEKRYDVLVKGYGLDGKVHEMTVLIHQGALRHQVSIERGAIPDLPLVNGYYRIPKNGVELEFTMNITPEPYPAFYPDFDTKLWRVECTYSTDKINVEYGSSVVRGGVSKITIKPNTWGHTLGLWFRMVPVDNLTYPSYSTITIPLIQEF